MPMRMNPIGIFGSIQLCCQNGMAVSHLSRVGYSGRRKDLSTTEFLQFVIMLCIYNISLASENVKKKFKSLKISNILTKLTEIDIIKHKVLSKRNGGQSPHRSSDRATQEGGKT